MVRYPMMPVVYFSDEYSRHGFQGMSTKFFVRFHFLCLPALAAVGELPSGLRPLRGGRRRGGGGDGQLLRSGSAGKVKIHVHAAGDGDVVEALIELADQEVAD